MMGRANSDLMPRGSMPSPSSASGENGQVTNGAQCRDADSPLALLDPGGEHGHRAFDAQCATADSPLALTDAAGAAGHTNGATQRGAAAAPAATQQRVQRARNDQGMHGAHSTAVD